MVFGGCPERTEHPGPSQPDQRQLSSWVKVSWLGFSLEGLFPSRARAGCSPSLAFVRGAQWCSGGTTVGPFMGIRVAGASEPALPWRFSWG